MERPEAQDTGSIILTGFDSNIVLNLLGYQFYIIIIMKVQFKFQMIIKLQIHHGVLKLIIGNTGLSNIWHGIKKNNK